MDIQQGGAVSEYRPRRRERDRRGLSFSPSSALIRDRIGRFESLKGQNVDLNKLADALASIRGATLGMTIRDEVFGKLKVDFKEDVSMTRDFAKPPIASSPSSPILHSSRISVFRLLSLFKWTSPLPEIACGYGSKMY
jgi:hypothetical protein